LKITFIKQAFIGVWRFVVEACMWTFYIIELDVFADTLLQLVMMEL